MIKVFSSNKHPEDNQVGEDLTTMITRWINSKQNQIEIQNIHTNSNKYGWMIVIHYKIIS
jgi:hypothetical protein